MSKVDSSSLNTADAASAPELETTSSQWAPHGAVLTACVVGINVLVIFLILFFFWRFFSVKRGPSASAGASGDDDASSTDSLPVASPWAWVSRWRRQREDLGAKLPDDVTSALPVYVYSGAGADAGEKNPECAVCIMELRDGDSARLLPLCGHRFHADCVGAWLRHHTTCPVCRARVVAATAVESRNKDVDGATACCV
ncbi:hypothetical protein BS78_09G114200 [Paspalum vaginatum]|nr:hypothetical protein BS78_09G114200 [Paspalum vaginatum]